jgi:Mg-chelatase subunit ChlD
MQADRGSTNVFKQTREGDDKNYSCMVVCDCSGSMRSRMSDVELAVGAVSYGLEEVGVDVSVLDTYDSKTSLAKPFGVDVESFEKKLFAGRIGGGTPIRHTVSFARQRIDRGKNDVPFMIVITDGGARKPREFMEEVKKANFPIIGLYLSDYEQEDQLKQYDRAVTASSEEDVGQKLINLINSIIF